MKILITGATGFMGSYLHPYLESQGHEVVKVNSKVADLTKEGTLEQFNAKKFDQIYHLACWTQAGDFCLYHPGEQWIINQRINTNVLAWWHAYQPQAKMIAMGSSCSYDPEMPHREENYMIGTPTPSLYTYAMIKRMLYAGLLALNKQYNLKYLYLVPSTLYGPNYPIHKGKQLHFIFDLIRKIVNGKQKGEPFGGAQGGPVVLWGDGYQKRELIYADDFIKIMVHLADTVDNEIFNMGGGAEYTIREFAQMICENIGYDPEKIQYDASKYVGAKEKFLITDKVKSYLPQDFQLTPLKEGLKKTVEWYLKSRGH